MSKNTKIAVGIAAVILLICCAGVAIAAAILPARIEQIAEGAIVENPSEVAESMLTYNLPAGFAEEGGMDILGMKTVMITSNDTAGSMIMLMQFPNSLTGDEASMQQQMEDSFSTQSRSQNVDFELVSSESKTINDTPATLSFYEGTTETGEKIRQVIGIFETKDGNTGMLMIVSPIDGWEETGLEQFLESLR